jgi:acetyl-CoA carboxylase carboxyltransferase component
MSTNFAEQYTQMVQQSQDAVRAAVENWTKTMQQAMGQLPATTASLAAPYDVNTVIDQVFDLAEKVLEAERDFAKNLIASTTAAGEAFVAQAKQAAEPATEATKPAAQDATKKS